MTRITKSTAPKHPEITEREPLSKAAQAEHAKAVKAQEEVDQNAAKDLEAREAEAQAATVPPAKEVKPAGHDLPTAQEARSTPQPQDARKDPEQPGSVVQNVVPEEQAKDPTAPEQPR